MPDRGTVSNWLIADAEFFNQYTRARDAGLDVMAEETLEIADTTQQGVKVVEKPLGDETTHADMIEHRRLRVDTRKWYLSKLAPKRYGDRSAVELTGADGGPIQLDDSTLAAKMDAIYAAAAARRAHTGDDLV